MLTCFEYLLNCLWQYLIKIKIFKNHNVKNAYIKNFCIGNIFAGPTLIRNIYIEGAYI